MKWQGLPPTTNKDLGLVILQMHMEIIAVHVLFKSIRCSRQIWYVFIKCRWYKKLFISYLIYSSKLQFKYRCHEYHRLCLIHINNLSVIFIGMKHQVTLLNRFEPGRI